MGVFGIKTIEKNRTYIPNPNANYLDTHFIDACIIEEFIKKFNEKFWS